MKKQPYSTTLNKIMHRPAIQTIAPHKRDLGVSLNVKLLSCLIVIFSSLVIFGLHKLVVQAASSPWTQTDWSGGVGSSTANQFVSATSIDVSTAGEFSLSLGTEQFSNTDFETDTTGWEAGSNPKNIANLKMWFKADSITGLSDGDAVSNWDDLSSSNFDASQSNATYRPLYKTNIINGKPVVRFDGANDYLENTSISGFTNQSSAFLMQKINGSQCGGSYELGVNRAVNSGASILPWCGSTMYSRVSGAGAGDITWAFSVPYTKLLTQIYNGPSANQKAWEDGTLKNTAGASSAFGTSPNSLVLGSLTPSNYWLQTDIAELIFYSAAVSDTDRKGIEAYIQNRWGLASSYHTITRDTGIKYSGTGSLKVVASSQDTAIWQPLTLGDTDDYTLEVYAYTDGSAVSGTDAVLVANGSAVTTAYTSVGGGWYKLSGTAQGAVTSRDFGVKVLSGKTVYLDDFSLTKYAATGVLTSNIFDTEFASDWGTLTYVSSGTGTVTVKARSGSVSNLSDAGDWSSCTAVASGVDLSSNDCIDDQDRYIQYQVTLSPASGSTPVVESVSIAFAASDQVDPVTNATNILITGASAGSWLKAEPTLTWTAGADNGGGIGLLGYCVSLEETTIAGSSTSLNPETSSGLLTGLDDGVSSAACPFIVSGTSFNLGSVSGLTLTTNKKYFFSIKAVDLAGNVYTGASGDYQDLTNFKFDNTAPTNVAYISTPSSNFGSVNDMFFTWPITGSSDAEDAQSGIIGWQYSINGTSNWRGPDTNAALGITYIENDLSTSEIFLTEGDDGDDIEVGTNTIYFRAVDGAGNFSDPVTGGISYGGAAPTFTGGGVVTITPSSNTENSFALSWPTALATEGSVATYYYMINRTPPATLATLEGNSTIYIPKTTTSVATSNLIGAVRGSNTVYVVAVDTADNYSPSNYISGTFTLNSTNPDAPQDVSASDTSIKSESIWRASLAWSEPDYKGAGSLTYIIQRSEDNSSWTLVSTTTGLSYTDTVDESTTYYYRIGAYDTSDESEDDPTYTTSVSILPKGAFDEAPSLSSGPLVSDITTKKATIKWSTSRVSDSKVQYGKSSGDYFEEEPSKSDQVTSHEVGLTNLDHGTKYYYKVKWTDEDGNTGVSSEKTFTTESAPFISDPKISNIGINSAVVDLTVQNASKIKIYYGKTTAFGSITELSTSTSESKYSVSLTDLEDGIRYYYRINGFDSENAEYEGTTLSFQTLPRPQISNVRLQQAKNTAQPTAVVSWSTNTEVSSIVTYFPSGNPSAARDEVNVALIRGEHRMIIRGLVPNTRYDLRVSGRDVAGNEAQSEVQTFTTATDTRPPSMSDLKVEGSSVNKNTQTQTSQLIVSWTSDEAATGQVEFGEGTGTVYSQKTQEDANYTFNHLVVIPGLTPSKVYHLRAVSKDKAGNVTQSIDIVTITPKASDNALDLVVSNLREAFGFALK